MFKPQSTDGLRLDGPTKTLLYAHHGWGKTTQAKHYKRRYGRGLIISGEAGLRSLAFDAIDYVPFSSWDGEHDPTLGVYSFRGIVRDMSSPDFRRLGYKWVMIDSWTEVADRLLEHLEPKYAGDKNGYKLWGDYSSLMIGAAKFLRDQPYHILVTSLMKEDSDDNGNTDYWPSVKGQQVGKLLPGVFDYVFGGVRSVSGDRKNPTVERFVVTDEVRGWHGKARDPRGRLKPVERVDDITELLDRVALSDADFEKLQRAAAALKAATPTKEGESNVAE